jgi:hypothetical protein
MSHAYCSKPESALELITRVTMLCNRIADRGFVIENMTVDCDDNSWVVIVRQKGQALHFRWYGYTHTFIVDSGHLNQESLQKKVYERNSPMDPAADVENFLSACTPSSGLIDPQQAVQFITSVALFCNRLAESAFIVQSMFALGKDQEFEISIRQKKGTLVFLWNGPNARTLQIKGPNERSNYELLEELEYKKGVDADPLLDIQEYIKSCEPWHGPHPGSYNPLKNQ